MTETFPTILLTRPRAQSERFAGMLRGSILPQVRILISPILEIRPLPATVPAERPAFLVLTSAHAAETIEVAPNLQGVTAYCVGEATAAAARGAGAQAIPAGGTATDLVERIEGDAPAGRGLYLRGRHVSADLAQMLADSGINVASLVVYDQVPLPLTDEARSLLEGPGTVVLPVFSARSARLLADACRGAAAQVAVAAMSGQVAAQWPSKDEVAAVAPAPTAEGMAKAVVACLAG